MPALTFWVVPEIARAAGLTPVFVDVDPLTFNMTADGFERAIGPRTVAVVPTHLWGLPCDMDDITAVARRHGIFVIEDCAHALGALYRDRPVGTLGDAAFFSFQTIKPLNTYGGGMAVVRDPALARRISYLAQSAPAPDAGASPSEVVAGPCATRRDAAASLHLDDVPSRLRVPAPEPELRRLLLGEDPSLQPACRPATTYAMRTCRPQLDSRA